MNNKTIINFFNSNNSNIANINTQHPQSMTIIIQTDFRQSQKDYHQDNLSFVCLQLYKRNCLNIFASNICYHKQQTSEESIEMFGIFLVYLNLKK